MISFSSSSVWESLRFIGIALAILAVIIGIVVWIGRRRGSRTVALDTALTISGLWAALSALSIVLFVVKAFTVDWAELDGTTSVSIPWPADLPCSLSGDSASTMLTCSSEPLTTFTVGGASLGLRLLAASAQISTVVLSTTPAVILAVICLNTLRGRAFSRTVTRALVGGAIAVLVFGVASDLLRAIAATVGLREVFPPDSEWYPPHFQLTVTPLPFVGALMLAALAAVFRQGLTLQHERDALERDKAALQDETRGLV